MQNPVLNRKRLQTTIRVVLGFAVVFTLALSAPGVSWADPPEKFDVCHIAPGHTTSFHTIQVPASAAARHLDHGDLLGACNLYCDDLCFNGDFCTVDCDYQNDRCIDGPAVD